MALFVQFFLDCQAEAQGYVVSSIGNGIAISVSDRNVDITEPLKLGLLIHRAILNGVPPTVSRTIEDLCRERVKSIGRVSDLFALAQEVETSLRQEGFALTRVVIPAQPIRNGDSVRLDVIDVRVEGLDLDALPSPIAIRARQLLNSLVDIPFLRANALTRIIGLLQIEFGAPLTTETPIGSRSDRVRLQVRGPLRGVIGEAGVGRMASRPFQHSLISGAATIFLPGELGARLTVSGTAGVRKEPDTLRGPLSSINASWLKPITADGSLFAEVGISYAGVSSETLSMERNNQYDYVRTSGRLGSPLRVGSDDTLIVKIGPDLTREGLRSTLSSYDDITDEHRAATLVMRAEAIWLRQFADRTGIELSSAVGAGWSDMQHRFIAGPLVADTRSTNAIGLVSSRIRATLPLWWDLSLTLNGRAQYAGRGALPLSEQFQLFRAGDAIVYDSAADQGADGIVARIDVGRSFPSAWLLTGSTIAPYVFVGGGAIWETSETTSQRRITGETWGMGTSLSLLPRTDVPVGITVGMEVYRQISTGTVPNHTGINVRLSSKF